MKKSNLFEPKTALLGLFALAAWYVIEHYTTDPFAKELAAVVRTVTGAFLAVYGFIGLTEFIHHLITPKK